MPISKLDHVNVRTAQLDRMIEWYSDVLGMESGARPPFPFPGAWMYADGAAVVHLIGVDGDPGAGSEGDLKLEHFAFAATDRAGFEAKLDAMGEGFRTSEPPGAGLVQYNIWDPDGNHIHVDFRLDE